MKSKEWNRIQRYAFALAAVAAAIVLARALDPYLSPHVSPPYFLAVMLSAAYAGAGPGLLATTLASLAIAWFDLGTTGTLDLGLDDLVRLAVFIVTAVIISSISAARKTAENDLRIALDQLAALDRSKDEFIATVSHELRTPLTSILGWLHILRDPDLPPDTRELALDSMERSARTQAMLVNDMLDASRIVLGKFHIERQPLLIRNTVRDAVAVVMPQAEDRNVSIRVEAASDGMVISADPDRLKQAIWNLLANAVKFTPEGGNVHVRISHDGHDAIVEVADDGEGIEEKLLPHVFERFTQEKESVRKGGLGIGLSLVKYIVEEHGGTVAAFSAGRNRGSRFTARLPLLRDGESHPVRVSGEHCASRPSAGA